VNKLTLGVLLCDSVHPDRREIDGDYPDVFTGMFRRYSPSGCEVKLRFYDVISGQYPQRLDECSGYLTTGACASVNDPDPWITDFEQFVRDLHKRECKLIAICFGHQMIAKALGGRVEHSDRGWGVGVHEVTIHHPEPWMIPTARSFRIVLSHQDQVTELPPNAEVLASTPHCPISLFRCGTLIGIQGHPEFSIPYAGALMESRAGIIPAETRKQAFESFAQEPDYTLLTSWMVHYLGSGATEEPE